MQKKVREKGDSKPEYPTMATCIGVTCELEVHQVQNN